MRGAAEQERRGVNGEGAAAVRGHASGVITLHYIIQKRVCGNSTEEKGLRR
jgi:hypothetical protein